MLRKLIFAILVLYSVVLLTFVLYQIKQKENPSFAKETSVSEDPSNKSLQIKGVDITNYFLSRFESRIKIDHMEIRPRRFSIFKIKSLNELHLNNVLIQTRTTPEVEADDNGSSSQEGQLFSSFKNFGELIEFGNVQRILFTNFEYQILLGETKLVDQSITADQAIYDVRKQVMTMKNAKVELISLSKLLTAPELKWNDKRQLWIVPKNASLFKNGQKLVIGQQLLDKNLERVN